uniref:NapR1 n=1 Tax=Streptomyces aculeolatus TaxID=270689 RepID=A7KGZ6_9ACTN|nr:NapR1 [Streptomyces aculeolatus]
MEHLVRHAVTTIRERFFEPLSLDDLAQSVRVSKYHFLRVFTRVTGVTPGRFLSAVRLHEAKRLLLSTSLTVADISAQVGYSSTGSFTRRFTESVGLSPHPVPQAVPRLRPPHAPARLPPPRLPPAAGRARTGGTAGGTGGGTGGGGKADRGGDRGTAHHRRRVLPRLRRGVRRRHPPRRPRVLEHHQRPGPLHPAPHPPRHLVHPRRGPQRPRHTRHTRHSRHSRHSGRGCGSADRHRRPRTGGRRHRPHPRHHPLPDGLDPTADPLRPDGHGPPADSGLDTAGPAPPPPGPSARPPAPPVRTMPGSRLTETKVWTRNRPRHFSSASPSSCSWPACSARSPADAASRR